MIDVCEYIRYILKKKGWTLREFADEINKVKLHAGLNGKTTETNISNFLNRTDDKHILRPKQLVIWEKALNLKSNTLVDMVAPPKTREGKKELKEIMQKVKN